MIVGVPYIIEFAGAMLAMFMVGVNKRSFKLIMAGSIGVGAAGSAPANLGLDAFKFWLWAFLFASIIYTLCLLGSTLIDRLFSSESDSEPESSRETTAESER